VVDQLVCMFLATAFIITMHEQICLVSCKSRSSLDTWPASAVASSSCSGPWVFLPLYSLSVTFMGLLSVISGSISICGTMNRLSMVQECLRFQSMMICIMCMLQECLRFQSKRCILGSYAYHGYYHFQVL
jgi:hypothetical protein